MKTTDKAEVIQALLAAVREELESVERVAAMARDEVISDESRQEGKYDTRATEASYLARGQAWRVVALRELVGWLEGPVPAAPRTSIQLGALVEVEGHSALLLIGPDGGATAKVGGRTVRMISPASPLGEALQDLEPGDFAEVDGPKGSLEVEVLSVR
jgi:transcription elongation GreA/GreB family factor